MHLILRSKIVNDGKSRNMSIPFDDRRTGFVLLEEGNDLSMIRKLVMTAICIAFLIVPASASGYRCTVKDAVTADGGVISHTELTKTYIGKEFIVDRGNGRMMGHFSGSGWDPKVLDYGSSQQSFKVMYTSAPYVHVRTLTVQEFATDGLKNFFMLDEDNFFSGKCFGVN